MSCDVRFLLTLNMKLIEIYSQMCKVYGNVVISEGGVQKWCISLKNDQMNVDNEKQTNEHDERMTKHCD